MARVIDRLRRLERRPAGRLPVMLLTIGLDDDGLYHGEGGATYDEAGKDALSETHQLIILSYGDWPPAGKTLARANVDFERL